MFLSILCSIKMERLLFLKFLKKLAFFDSYFWPFNKTHEKIIAIFVIRAIMASIWNVFIKFRWRDEKFLRPFPCHICNKTFSQKGAVNKHVLIVHEGKIPSFQCETCGKNFTAKAKLKSHVLTVHEGVKPYKCDFENCEAAFTGKQNLEGHILTIHKGQWKNELQRVTPLRNELLCQLFGGLR